MFKSMKAIAAIMLTAAMILVAGCKPEDEPNNGGGGNNGGNNGGGETSLPVVTTSSVSEITETSAIGGGVVTSEGGLSVVERGVCWSAQNNPDVTGSHAMAGTGAGTFSCEIVDLEPNTTYYVRAYAINSLGVGYGNQVSFITLSDNGGGASAIPVVETSPVSEITETSAIGSGVVTSDGGGNVVERGVCWSTQNNPDVSGFHASNGTGTGAFSCAIDDLEPNTTYFVRAYAINSKGVGYGEQRAFTTLSEGPAVPTGAINGLFTINSSGDQVYFSQGNLQYQASTNTWRFAEEQYYIVGGESNSCISPTYSGWIDLFGWGTSGYNNKYPYMTSTNSGDYGGGNGNITSSPYDWGIYNKISNGGNQEGLWRTLSKEEWKYLLNTRYTPSGIRFAMAQVDGVAGVIIVPDDWSVSTFVLNNPNQDVNCTNNTVEAMVWRDTFEPAGAVFLPAAGLRLGASCNRENAGFYWSTSCDGSYGAYYMGFFDDGGVVTQISLGRCYGQSVRLVRDVQ